MAKKSKGQTIEFLYVNEEDKKKKDKTKNKKSKKINNNLPKVPIPKNDIIDLDNEIIIGLTPTNKNNEGVNNKHPQKKQTSQSPTKKVEPPKKNINKKNKSKKKQIKEKAKKPQKTSVDNKSQNVKQFKKPSKKGRIKVKVLKWTTIALLIIGVAIAFMLSPVFNIKQIEVTGNSKITTEEILTLAGINTNTNTFKVNKSKTIQKLKQSKYIEDVKISRELPGTIKIEIKERTPKYVLGTSTINVVIDHAGYVLELTKGLNGLPILIGYSTEQESILDYENTKKLNDEDCKRLEMANQVLKAAEDNNILPLITSIDISNIKDIRVSFDAEKKVADLGHVSNANTRMQYLITILKDNKGKEGEIFVDGDINNLRPKPYFREKV